MELLLLLLLVPRKEKKHYSSVHLLLDFAPIKNVTLQFDFSRYSIGNSDLTNGIKYGWLYRLAETIEQPYTHETALR